MYFLQFGDVHSFECVDLLCFFISNFEHFAVGPLIELPLCDVLVVVEHFVDECDLVLHYVGRMPMRLY